MGVIELKKMANFRHFTILYINSSNPKSLFLKSLKTKYLGL